MEKQPHQEYRDDLANKLKEIRNSDLENSEIAKAKAEGYLDSEKNKEEYVEARKFHHKYVESYVLENASAEKRVDKVLEEIKKRYKDTLVSREDILSGLKAVDNLYKAGIVPDNGFYLLKAFEYSDDGYMEKYFGFKLGSKDEYDLKAAYNKISENTKLAEIIIGFDQYGFNEGTHVNRIVQCSGDHDGCDRFTHPTSYECSSATSGGLKDRAEKLKNFLEEFKKSPEQIEKDREDARLKMQAEEDERQRQIKEKELNKFDPSI